MSFDFATVDDTAVSGADYVFTTGTITIPATQTTSSFTVVTTNDTIRDLDPETKVCRPEIKNLFVVAAAAPAIQQNCWDWPEEGDFPS